MNWTRHIAFALLGFIGNYGSMDSDATPWWRHQMEKFSALLALCAGNLPVTGEFPMKASGAELWCFLWSAPWIRLSKQSWGWWFETLSRPLWLHRNAVLYLYFLACQVITESGACFVSHDLLAKMHLLFTWQLRSNILAIMMCAIGLALMYQCPSDWGFACLHWFQINCYFLAATKQLYEWYFLSVCLSVRLSVRLSVTPFWLCSHHRIIKFSGVITKDQGNVHAKGQGQRSKVKVTEVTTQLNRFRTVTPVWIHIWRLNDTYSLMLLRRGALLFFKVICQISRSHGANNRRIWPTLGVSGL